MRANWLSEDGDVLDAIDLQVLSENDVIAGTLDTNPSGYQGPLDGLKAANGYIEQDEVALTPQTPNLDDICAKFVDEHYHDDDEVRFVLEGAGVFDIRSRDDRWMRVQVEAGDLLVVPANRHHRFFLTDAKMIRCIRLFKDSSGWVPHYRAA